MFYSDTLMFSPGLMLYLSTFLQCKCKFSPKMFVVLNKTITFAVCYYKTHKYNNKNFATMTTTTYNLFDAINRDCYIK